MNDKGITKTSIVMIVVLVLIAAGVAFYLISNRAEDFTYYTAKLSKATNNTLIDTNRDMYKLIKSTELSTLQNAKTYNKIEASEYFNEEYFQNKKVVVICLYEDNSRIYVHSIDKVEYNEDRTKVTVEYTYDGSQYAEPINSTWQQYMLLEVDGTVTEVEFQKTDLKK